MTKTFRLYLMDRLTGHIVQVREVNASDDARALLIAHREDWLGPLELWDGGRKVLRREALK